MRSTKSTYNPNYDLFNKRIGQVKSSQPDYDMYVVIAGFFYLLTVVWVFVRSLGSDLSLVV